MSYNANSGADAGSASASGRGLKVGLVAGLVPLAIIVGLVYSVVHNTQPAGASTSASMPGAVAQRIQKVGAVELADTSGPHAARSGEEVYKSTCIACHGTGALGSPKFGDATAWGPRVTRGFEALVQSAVKGKNAMPPQGGGALSDLEIGRGVVYMANAGGAKFAEPAAPAAAASAPVVAKK